MYYLLIPIMYKQIELVEFSFDILLIDHDSTKQLSLVHSMKI